MEQVQQSVTATQLEAGDLGEGRRVDSAVFGPQRPDGCMALSQIVCGSFDKSDELVAVVLGRELNRSPGGAQWFSWNVEYGPGVAACLVSADPGQDVLEFGRG